MIFPLRLLLAGQLFAVYSITKGTVSINCCYVLLQHQFNVYLTY